MRTLALLGFGVLQMGGTMLVTQPLCRYPPAASHLRLLHESKALQRRSRPPLSKICCKVDWVEDWIEKNDALVRGAPIVIGSASMVAVVLNRTFSGVPLVASASSSLSRADVLTIALAATVLLTGLVWKSVQPKPLIAVELEGVECVKTAAGLPDDVLWELNWTWESLQSATRCRALVLVYQDTCVLQAGVAAESDGQPVPVDAVKLMQGSLCKEVTATGKQNYLANLALYPGRAELPFFPRNTQAVILQPIEHGVLIAASDTIRGFDSSDQGWIRVISEKLEATFDELYAGSETTAETKTADETQTTDEMQTKG